MREPWETFFEQWRAVAGARRGEGRDAARFAGATSHAARATLRALRDSWDWSFIHSSILVGQFVEASDRWAQAGRSEAQLREWLRAIWAAETELRRIEQERRSATEAVLAA